MSENWNAKLIEGDNGNKLFVVASINDGNDIVIDSRSKKPVGVDQGQKVIYLQEINRIEFNKGNSKQNNILSYFAPNNVGILLSIASKALLDAKTIYEEKIDPDKNGHTDILDEGTGKELSDNTLIVYEYIEAIQTSIVFGYTAIEAFTNLSIPEYYQYKNIIGGKGITEIYDKKAIERWLSLDIKISSILVDIYECESIKKDKIWNKFKRFEECRNEIIHQKSIDINSFYEKYFNKEIFDLCSIPEKTIKFFFEKGKEKGINNILWPLIINDSSEIPIYGDNGDKSVFVKCAGVLREY